MSSEAEAWAVKLAPRLPDGEADGLTPQARGLVEYPARRRWAIVELQTTRVMDDITSRMATATVGIVRIVLLSDTRARQAQALLVAEPNGAGPHLFTDDPDTEAAPAEVTADVDGGAPVTGGG